jgi:hypothetical protein
MIFQQNGIEREKIHFLLKSNPEVLFAEFAEACKLQKIDSAFDTGKQPKTVGYKILARLAHF